VHHQIDIGGELFRVRRVMQPDLHEAVFRANVKIGQETNAGFGGDARFDEVEIVAGEDDFAPGELFRLPQAVRAGGGQGGEGPPRGGGGVQVSGAGVEAVTDGAQTADDQVVLRRADGAQRDVRLALFAASSINPPARFVIRRRQRPARRAQSRQG